MSSNRSMTVKTMNRSLLCLFGGTLLCGLASCEDRQVLLVTVENQPPGLSSMGAYYRLNGGPWNGIGIRNPQERFGLELPVGQSALLDLQLFAYRNGIPCSIASSAGSVELPGKYRQDLSLKLAPSESRCVSASEPADFPTTKMSVSALASNDVWIVGEAGKVLHWDGSQYSKIPLPTEFRQKPPDWNAVVAIGPADAWMVGSEGAVAHYAGGVLTKMASMTDGTGNPAATWRSITVVDSNKRDLLFVGTAGNLGYIAPGSNVVSVSQLRCRPPSTTTVTPISEDMNAVYCAKGGPIDCWFVGAGGTIAQLYSNLTAPVSNCIRYPSPTTNELTGVFETVTGTPSRIDIRIVGKGGVVIRGVSSATQMIGFTDVSNNYASYLPASVRSSDLNAIAGTSASDLWVVGSSGLLLSWQDTPHPPSGQMPFSVRAIGLSGSLTSVSSNNDGLFIGGSMRTLGYLGPLFTPVQ